MLNKNYGENLRQSSAFVIYNKKEKQIMRMTPISRQIYETRSSAEKTLKKELKSVIESVEYYSNKKNITEWNAGYLKGYRYTLENLQACIVIELDESLLLTISKEDE